LKNEHDSAERAAIQNSTNLAGAFEEHLSRSLSEIDRCLKIIRTLYGRDPARFDLVDWLKSNRVLTDGVLQITVIDRDESGKAGNLEGTARKSSDFRNSESYKAHADHPTIGLLSASPPSIRRPETGLFIFRVGLKTPMGPSKV